MINLSTDFYESKWHFYFKCDCPDNPSITFDLGPATNAHPPKTVSCMRCGKVWNITEVPRLIATEEE